MTLTISEATNHERGWDVDNGAAWTWTGRDVDRCRIGDMTEDGSGTCDTFMVMCFRTWLGGTSPSVVLKSKECSQREARHMRIA